MSQRPPSRNRILLLMAGLIIGSIVSVIGVVLIVLTVFDGGIIWRDSMGITGMIVFVIGMIMIEIFAKKSKFAKK